MMKGSPGLFNIIGQAWQRGGPGAFFTGNMTDIIRITPQKAIQLAAFDKYKSFFSRKDKVCIEIDQYASLSGCAGG
eukprot:3429832-Pyramimonas_sp.AAC.2